MYDRAEGTARPTERGEYSARTTNNQSFGRGRRAQSTEPQSGEIFVEEGFNLFLAPEKDFKYVAKETTGAYERRKNE
jgi:hypothetical protein